MSRLPLIHIPHGLYSVVSKCNNGEFLFNADEKFKLYLKHLIQCKRYFGFVLYDLVCMSNHVHELYKVPEKVTIADILQRVKGGFARKFNKRFNRKDHFWRNKPFYRIVEDEAYAFNSMNYYHINPVVAGLVDSPEKWPYSGYRFHILGDRSGLIGKLLSPLPEWSAKPNWNIRKSVELVLRGKRKRFIGSPEYRKRMRSQYGR